MRSVVVADGPTIISKMVTSEATDEYLFEKTSFDPLQIKGEENAHDSDRDLRRRGRKRQRNQRTGGNKKTARKNNVWNNRPNMKKRAKRGSGAKPGGKKTQKKPGNTVPPPIKDYYPSWDDTTCLDDGKYPKYYEKSASLYFSDTAEKCCRVHFKGLVKDCVRLAKGRHPNGGGQAGGGQAGKAGKAGGYYGEGKIGKAGKAGGYGKSGKFGKSQYLPVTDMPTYMPTYLPTTYYPTYFPTYGADNITDVSPTAFPTTQNETYYPTPSFTTTMPVSRISF